jgi:hypothetical protein
LLAGLFLVPLLQGLGSRHEDRGRVLIAAGGPPVQDFRWVAGAPASSVAQAADGTFTLRSPDVGMVELLALPPWTSYRLEADVRQDAGSGFPLGIYAARSPHAGSRESPNCFLAVGVAGRQGAAKAEFLLGWYGEAGTRGMGGSNLGRRDLPPAEAGPAGQGSWHRIAIEVTPDGIAGFVDGDCIARHTLAELQHRCEAFVKESGSTPPRVNPAGGVGLVVSGGTASFRNVTISPANK